MVNSLVDLLETITKDGQWLEIGSSNTHFHYDLHTIHDGDIVCVTRTMSKELLQQADNPGQIVTHEVLLAQDELEATIGNEQGQ